MITALIILLPGLYVFCLNLKLIYDEIKLFLIFLDAWSVDWQEREMRRQRSICKNWLWELRDRRPSGMTWTDDCRQTVRREARSVPDIPLLYVWIITLTISLNVNKIVAFFKNTHFQSILQLVHFRIFGNNSMLFTKWIVPNLSSKRFSLLSEVSI